MQLKIYHADKFPLENTRNVAPEGTRIARFWKILVIVSFSIALASFLIYLAGNSALMFTIMSFALNLSVISGIIYAIKKPKNTGDPSSIPQQDNNQNNQPQAKEAGRQAFTTAGIIVFTMALLSFFILMTTGAYGLLSICSFLAVCSILLLAIGMKNSGESKGTAVVLIVLSVMLLLLSEIIRIFSAYP